MENPKISFLKEYIKKRIAEIEKELEDKKHEEPISIEFAKYEKGLLKGELIVYESIKEIISTGED